MKQRLRRSGYCILPLLAYLAALVASFVVYHRISLGVPRMTAAAHQHAASLIDLEGRLHVLWEPHIQYIALHHANIPVVGFWLNNAAVRNDVKLIYSGGQIPWLGSMLVWLLLFRPQVFRRICILAIAASLIGLFIAALYPVAPPRFAMVVAPYHIQDISSLISSEKDLVRFGGFDPYASMPSLHVLWSLITAAGLFQATNRWGPRFLTFVFPAAIVASVIITGNHYVLDCVGAAVVFSTCLVCHKFYCRLVGTQGRSVASSASDLSAAQRIGRERRTEPDLRSLDFPILFTAFTGMLLLPTSDNLPRVLGLLLLAAGAVAPGLARKRIAAGISLRAHSPTAEWYSGFLLVLGATTLGANDYAWREVGSVIWAAAGLLPLLSRFGPISMWSIGRRDIAQPTLVPAVPLRTRDQAAGVLPGNMQGAVNHRGENRTA